MKKGCLIALGAFVGFIALIVGIALLATGDVVKAGDEFIALLGQGKSQEAYQSTSTEFRKLVAEPQFGVVVQQLKLDEARSVSWGSREVNDDGGKLAGTVTFRDGSTSDISMDLVKEEGVWKVLGFSSDVLKRSGIKVPPPGDPELRELVLNSMLAFNTAVKAADFTSFHTTLAKPFRAQHTAEQLKEAFQGFVEKQIDFSVIRGVQPEFDGPVKVSDAGVLAVAGAYPTKPTQVNFSLSYLFEDAQWKLIAIDVSLK